MLDVKTVGLVFLVAGIIVWYYMKSKVKWDHPVMFCYYNLVIMGLGVSIFPMVTQWAFLSAILLLIVTLLKLPSKELLEVIENESSILKDQGKPVVFLDVLVSDFKRILKRNN
ncbi:hypothetical protein ACET9Z_04895 [Aeromonas veronii]|uniref:hypothetical protein n=1 Tax=Aeromonas veronii TaxID=654 RepID=UPI0038F01B13